MSLVERQLILDARNSGSLPTNATTLKLTPIDITPTSGNQILVDEHVYVITNGSLPSNAKVIAGCNYMVEFRDEHFVVLKRFKVSVPISTNPVSIAELYTSQSSAIDPIAETVLRKNDDIANLSTSETDVEKVFCPGPNNTITTRSLGDITIPNDVVRSGDDISRLTTEFNDPELVFCPTETGGITARIIELPSGAPYIIAKHITQPDVTGGPFLNSGRQVRPIGKLVYNGSGLTNGNLFSVGPPHTIKVIPGIYYLDAYATAKNVEFHQVVWECVDGYMLYIDELVDSIHGSSEHAFISPPTQNKSFIICTFSVSDIVHCRLTHWCYADNAVDGMGGSIRNIDQVGQPNEFASVTLWKIG